MQTAGGKGGISSFSIPRQSGLQIASSEKADEMSLNPPIVRGRAGLERRLFSIASFTR